MQVEHHLQLLALALTETCETKPVLSIIPCNPLAEGLLANVSSTDCHHRLRMDPFTDDKGTHLMFVIFILIAFLFNILAFITLYAKWVRFERAGGFIFGRR